VSSEVGAGLSSDELYRCNPIEIKRTLHLLIGHTNNLPASSPCYAMFCINYYFFLPFDLCTIITHSISDMSLHLYQLEYTGLSPLVWILGLPKSLSLHSLLVILCRSALFDSMKDFAGPHKITCMSNSRGLQAVADTPSPSLVRYPEVLPIDTNHSYQTVQINPPPPALKSPSPISPVLPVSSS